MITLYTILILYALLTFGFAARMKIKQRQAESDQDSDATKAVETARALTEATSEAFSRTTAHPAATSTFGAWRQLKGALLAANEGWEVWIDWYENQLAGKESLSEEFEIALAAIPDEVWRQGPRVVNTRIRQLLEARTSPPPIPQQAVPPYFGLKRGRQLRLIISDTNQ